MNYETFIKERQHLNTLLKPAKLTKEDRISARKDPEHLVARYIFYPIPAWPSSIKKILEHNTITNKNTFQLILFAYGNEISPNVFIEYLYTFILNIPSKIKKRTHQIHWIVTNINTHQHKWYYFDMYHQSFLFFDALEKN